MRIRPLPVEIGSMGLIIVEEVDTQAGRGGALIP